MKRSHLKIPESAVFNERVNPSGGGQSYKRDNLTEHGQRLLANYQELRSNIVGKNDEEFTSNIFIQVKTPSDAKAKDYKFNLKKLGFELLSFSQKDETIAKVKIKKTFFHSLESKIKSYATIPGNPGKTNLAVIDTLEEIPLEEKLPESLLELADGEVDFIISLYTVLSKREKEVILNSIYHSLEIKNVLELKTTRFPSGQTIVSGRANVNTLKEIGAEYFTISSIVPNGFFSVGKTFSAEALPPTITVDKPATEIIVGLVDSGVDPNSKVFKDLVVETQNMIPNGSKNNYTHGSFVGSRIVFGDNIENQVANGTLKPLCKLFNLIVLGEDSNGNTRSFDEATLTHILSSLIIEKKDIKIYNLSLGSEESVQTGSFSVFAKELDFLSRDQKILFIISAGNIERAKGGFPQHFLHPNARVQPPAESLLSLSVGSVANHSTNDMISRAKEISSFSCVGPGSDDGVKPELVAHGGNVLTSGGVSARGAVYGLNADATSLAYYVGTSFSAPIISNYAAQIYNEFEDATPNLVKALLVHFADRVLFPTLPGKDHIDFCGFGEPNIEKCLYSTDSNVGLIYQGELEKDVYKNIKFHVPKSFAGSGQNRLQIRITVVYDPPINLNNHKEYSQCRVTASLEKNTASGLKEIAISGDAVYNKPFSPILHFQKNFKRGYAVGEWRLKLRLYIKDTLPATFKQSFAVIIEVLDVQTGLPVYSDLVNEYREIYHVRVLRKVA